MLKAVYSFEVNTDEYVLYNHRDVSILQCEPKIEYF